MVKTRFSVVDSARMAAEVNHLLAGSWVQNIYTMEDDAKTFLFKVTGRGDKYLLLLESGVRFHPTEFVRDKSEAPTGFAMKLRKHVRGRRLEYCRQVGLDRVVDFAFGKGTQHHHVVLEMYAGGNVILTDEKGIILTLLRPYTLEDGDLRVAVGQKYPFDLALEGPRALLSTEQPVSPEVLTTFFETFLTQVAEEEAKYDGAGDSDDSDEEEEAASKPKKGPVTVKGEKPAVKPQKRKKRKDRKKRPAELEHKRELVQALASKGSPVQSFGPQLIEHCLVTSGLDPLMRVADLKFVTENADKLIECLREAPKVLASLRDELAALPGFITLAAGGGDYYEDFEPIRWATSTVSAATLKEFSTFHLAVDEYFAKIEAQRAEKQRHALERANQSKIENVKKQQAERVDQLVNAVDERDRQAQILESNVERVDQCIAAVNTLLASGMSWEDVDRVVRNEKRNGNPVASCISGLKLAENKIQVALHDDEEESEDEGEDEEEEEPKGKGKAKSKSKKPSRIVVDVDLSLSAQANVGAIFAEKKRAAVKAKITQERAQKAVEEMEQKLAQQQEAKRKGAKGGAGGGVRQVRKPFWFEKYHWFITSEGVLVLGGKDAHQNEQLFKRFLRKGDAYLHADIHGAPTVIVRNPYYRTGTARTIPPESMREAGIFCVCKSPAWQAKVVTSAWWVESAQVSRTAPSGEYLPTGSFMIRGKKNYLQPTRLEMGFGYIFKIDETAKDAALGGAAPTTSEDEGSKEWRYLRGKLPPLSEEVLASLNNTEAVPNADGDLFSVTSGGTVTNNRPSKGAAKSQTISNGKEANASKSHATAVDARPPSADNAPKSNAASKKKLLKQKRAQAKYGDQTEEERRLAMIALGHALPDTPSTEQTTEDSEDHGEDSTDQGEAEEGGEKPKTWLERSSKSTAQDSNVKPAASPEKRKDDDGIDDAVEGEDGEEGDEPKADEEEDETADAEQEQGEEELLIGFTANPQADDTILYALPVCAPIESMSHFKFRVKLTPGQLKKGKAAKQAAALFQSRASDRERLVINAVSDPENVAVMMMDVKVSAPGLEKVRANIKSQQRQAKKEHNAAKQQPTAPDAAAAE